jgi:hypothetical protein
MAKNTHLKIVFYKTAAIILNFDRKEKAIKNVTDPKET